MQSNYNLSIEKGKEVLIQGNNNHIEIVGEEIESPFVSVESANDFCCMETGEEKEGDKDISSALEILDEDKMFIRLKQDMFKHYVFHFPASWEQRLSIELSNGKIFLKNINGALKARSSNGSVEMENISGDITSISSNGSVRGNKVTGTIDISASNGRVVLRESFFNSGSIKSGNGKISLQLDGAGAGNVNLFSGNGRIKLALKDDLNGLIKVQTRGKLVNHLEGYTVMTDKDITTLKKGDGDYQIYIANFSGGVRLMGYDDFDKKWPDEDFEFRFETEFNPGDFFEHIFHHGFGRGFPGFIHKIIRMGDKFGKMGEEMSRNFWESKPEKEEHEEEIRMVLTMLKEGKISTEEAERLINAIKSK
ncbi:MAG: hypothetical protein JW969_19195 [Spirochaetales bacterium]|nr:hypothetical protein [Spirochaetales bacterium]